MSETDVVIAALRTEHDALAALASRLSDQDLLFPSGAADWDVSQVLGHLGSAAVLNLGTMQAAAGESGERQTPESVWGRWNAMSPRERAEQYVAADEALVEWYEALSEEQRTDLRIDLGFLPTPVSVAVAGRMRLSEATLHSWDARVAFDETAVLGAEATSALLHGEPDLIGWTARPQALDGHTLDLHVTTIEPSSAFTLHVGDRVELVLDQTGPADGGLDLPAESWLRLVAGRLTPEHTPAGLTSSGAADLDLVRRIFPGY